MGLKGLKPVSGCARRSRGSKVTHEARRMYGDAMMSSEEVSGEIYIPSPVEEDEGTLDEPVSVTLVSHGNISI